MAICLRFSPSASPESRQRQRDNTYRPICEVRIEADALGYESCHFSTSSVRLLEGLPAVEGGRRQPIADEPGKIPNSNRNSSAAQLAVLAPLAIQRVLGQPTWYRHDHGQPEQVADGEAEGAWLIRAGENSVQFVFV